MEKFRKSYNTLLPNICLYCFLLFLSVFTLPFVSIADTMSFLRIGTGPNQGTYFEIGTEIAKRISQPPGSEACTYEKNCGIPGLIAIALTTSGSDENLRTVNHGELQAAFVQENLAYLAYFHKGPYEHETESFTNMRSVMHLAKENVQIIVKDKSSYKKISDLKGKKIALGLKGSGTAIDAFTILKAYGLHKKEFTPIYMAPSQSTNALLHDEIDAIFMIGQIPSQSISHLADQTQIRLLSVNNQQLKTALQRVTFFTPDLIPKGTYGSKEDIQTISSKAVLIVHKDLSDVLVYKMLSLLKHLNDQKKLKFVHFDQTITTSHENIPLHPGAEKFYKEHNLINETPNKAHTQN